MVFANANGSRRIKWTILWCFTSERLILFWNTASKQISFQDLVSHLDIIVALHKKEEKIFHILHIICNQYTYLLSKIYYSIASADRPKYHDPYNMQTIPLWILSTPGFYRYFNGFYKSKSHPQQTTLRAAKKRKLTYFDNTNNSLQPQAGSHQ